MLETLISTHGSQSQRSSRAMPAFSLRMGGRQRGMVQGGRRPGLCIAQSTACISSRRGVNPCPLLLEDALGGRALQTHNSRMCQHSRHAQHCIHSKLDGLSAHLVCFLQLQMQLQMLSCACGIIWPRRAFSSRIVHAAISKRICRPMSCHACSLMWRLILPQPCLFTKLQSAQRASPLASSSRGLHSRIHPRRGVQSRRRCKGPKPRAKCHPVDVNVLGQTLLASCVVDCLVPPIMAGYI